MTTARCWPSRWAAAGSTARVAAAHSGMEQMPLLGIPGCGGMTIGPECSAFGASLTAGEQNARHASCDERLVHGSPHDHTPNRTLNSVTGSYGLPLLSSKSCMAWLNWSSAISSSSRFDCSRMRVSSTSSRPRCSSMRSCCSLWNASTSSFLCLRRRYLRRVKQTHEAAHTPRSNETRTSLSLVVETRGAGLCPAPTSVTRTASTAACLACSAWTSTSCARPLAYLRGWLCVV